MEKRMSNKTFQDLVIQTLVSPRDAAERLLQMSLQRQALWMALGLMSVLNAIFYSVAIRINPPEDPASMAMIPPAFQSPLLFTMFLFGALVITVFVLQWIGQALGGTGEVGDVLVLLVWLQVMRLLFQIAVLVLSMLSPSIAAIFVMGGSIYAIYILAAFIDKAHGFDNLLKALGVIVLALGAVALGASIFFTIIAAVFLGGSGNV
jgi:hypothetical protein